MTAEREGVIKFDLDFEFTEPLPWRRLAELEAWRRVLFRLELIGQDPARYGGLGFGNASCRTGRRRAAPNRRAFIITGTQTGGRAELTARDYVTVERCDPGRNRLRARGPARPSSESLTHGAVYAASADIEWVLHGHSPQVWRHGGRLGLPATDRRAAYGTPAMAAEVGRLLDESGTTCGVFTMAGHTDGVVAYGPSGERATLALVAALGRAMALDSAR